ncbi:MAG: DUF2946 family protein [Pseudomonadota bacterium]
MQHLRRHLRAFSRLTLGVMLALVLLPTFAQVLAHHQGPGPWSEICRTPGVSAAAAPAGPQDSSPASPALMRLAHCPFCVVLDAPPVLPAPAPAPWVPLLARALGPWPALTLPADPAAAWAAIRKQGPPLIA